MKPMNQKKKKNEGSVNHPIGSSAHLLEVPLKTNKQKKSMAWKKH